MIKIFLALVSVFVVLAIGIAVKFLLLPLRILRGIVSRKPASA